MKNLIIDCCSLINLYTGWRGLTELRKFSSFFYVADAILAEAQYTREFDTVGQTTMMALNLQDCLDASLLQRIKPESDEEINWYVRLATDLDDGEAQALAIAKVRGFVLLTDDAKAARIAATPEVRVETTSTIAVLHEWLGLDSAHESQIREIVRRITVLGRFRPPVSHPQFDWWSSMTSGSAS